MSAYDAIARLYDPWSTGVVEDISFYVDEALAAGGELVELGVGTGRIAIPTALAGAHLIGVDSSREMLAVCAERAREAGVDSRLELRALELVLSRRERRLEGLAHGVQRHPGLPVAHLPQRELQLTAAAEVMDARLLELGERRRRLDGGQSLLLQRLRVHGGDCTRLRSPP